MFENIFIREKEEEKKEKSKGIMKKKIFLNQTTE